MFWVLRFLVKKCIKICSLVTNKMNSERVGSDWLCEETQMGLHFEEFDGKETLMGYQNYIFIFGN